MYSCTGVYNTDASSGLDIPLCLATNSYEIMPLQDKNHCKIISSHSTFTLHRTSETLTLAVQRYWKVESQNMLSWKGSIRIIESISWLFTRQPQESYQMPESAVQKLLVLCHAWCCDHFPREPVPVTNHPLGENRFS